MKLLIDQNTSFRIVNKLSIHFPISYAAIIAIFFAISGCNNQPTRQLDNTFYCQNTMWQFDNRPETPQQKAELMKAIGFDGLEGFGYKDFFELNNALQKEGLEMPVNYVGLDFNADGTLKGNAMEEIKEMIRSSEKGSVIYFHLHLDTHMNDKATGNKIIIPMLQALADYAADYDVKLCTYPHLKFYCETVGHSVKLAEMVNRDNYGAVLNLCHMLKVEGSEDIKTKLEVYTPWLFAVNINGADDGDTKNYGWDHLIQPLGQGTFDTYGFVKMLKDNGYEGPIGVQCFGLKGDVVETLKGIMETWKSWQVRYVQEH